MSNPQPANPKRNGKISYAKKAWYRMRLVFLCSTLLRKPCRFSREMEFDEGFGADAVGPWDPGHFALAIRRLTLCASWCLPVGVVGVLACDRLIFCGARHPRALPSRGVLLSAGYDSNSIVPLSPVGPSVLRFLISAFFLFFFNFSSLS